MAKCRINLDDICHTLEIGGHTILPGIEINNK